MTLIELIAENGNIFRPISHTVIHMGSDSDAVDEYWYQVMIGQHPTEDGEDTCFFPARLSLFQTTAGDIKAEFQLVNFVGEAGEQDRTFIPMRNKECMLADLKAKAKEWEIPNPDLESVEPLFVACEKILMDLSYDVQCKGTR